MPKDSTRLPTLLAALLLTLGLAACLPSGNGLLGQGPMPPVLTRQGEQLPWPAFVARLRPQRAVFVGEVHVRYDHHLVQLAVLKALHGQDPALAVGLEWFQRPYQQALDDWVAGRIDEAEMLHRTQYFERWRYDYRLVRPILRWARERGVPLVALRPASELSDAVSRHGLAGLSPAQRARLPTEIHPADPAYRADLQATFEHHAQNRGGLKRFLEVQRVWDETMAEAAADYLRRHPGRRMALLIGFGHMADGHGVPADLKRHLAIPTTTVMGNAERARGRVDYLVLNRPATLPPTGLLGAFLDTGDGQVAISGFSPGSAAPKAGLRKGDRILAIDDRPVRHFADLKLALLERQPGERVRVTVRRGEGTAARTLTVAVPLVAAPREED